MVRLRAFLEYYVVRGLHPSASLSSKMCRRGSGSGRLARQELTMPPAPITQADIPASNGTLHVFGGLISP